MALAQERLLPSSLRRQIPGKFVRDAFEFNSKGLEKSLLEACSCEFPKDAETRPSLVLPGLSAIANLLAYARGRFSFAWRL